MSLESARKKIESKYWRLPDEAWQRITEHCYYEGEDEEDPFIGAACEVMEIVQACVRALKPTEDKPLPKKPGRKSDWTGRYPKAFDKEYALHLFLSIEKSKVALDALRGWEYKEPSRKELYSRYKTAIDPTTGQPFTKTYSNFDAFDKACDRLKDKEFYNLTEDEQSALTVQMFFDAWDFVFVHGFRKKPASLCDNFGVVRQKRKGITPEWQGELTQWDVYDLMEDIVESVAFEDAYKESDQQAQPREKDIESSQVSQLIDFVTHEAGDSPQEEDWLRLREVWNREHPELHFRSADSMKRHYHILMSPIYSPTLATQIKDFVTRNVGASPLKEDWLRLHEAWNREYPELRFGSADIIRSYYKQLISNEEATRCQPLPVRRRSHNSREQSA